MAKSIVRGIGAGFQTLRDGEIGPGPPLPPQVGTGDPATDLAQIARDINALVEHFVLPNFLQATIINLASGTSIRIDSLTQRVGSIIVSIITGKLDVWWQDQTGVQAGTISHMEFVAIGAPVQIVLPPEKRIFTCLANGALTQGCFTMSSS